jgi:hypothetical protein
MVPGDHPGLGLRQFQQMGQDALALAGGHFSQRFQQFARVAGGFQRADRRLGGRTLRESGLLLRDGHYQF